MTRISLPIHDWDLLLTSRFAQLGSLWQEMTFVLLLAAPLLLLIWLYRVELRLVRWPAAVLLLAMRVIAVGLLWFVVCWQPVLARTESEQLPSRIFIAADISGSMTVKDPQRSTKEKLELAKLLRVPTDDGNPSEAVIAGWIDHYDKHGDDTLPPWASAGEKPDPRKRKQLAASRKRLHDELCKKIDDMTRLDVVRAILSERGLNLIRRLKKKHHVELILFDERASTKTKSALTVPKQSESPSLFTDLSTPLSRSLELATNKQGKTVGVVLLSDGIHNTDSSPVDKAKELHGYNIPIFPVAVGSSIEPPDVVLSEVIAPTNVLQNTPSEITAQIKIHGVPKRDFLVELKKPGKPPTKEHQEIIHHDGRQKNSYTVRFPIRPDETGIQSLEVQVRPLKGTVKELSDKNNAKTVVLRVIEDKAKVLLVDEKARWEYHYLAGALLRDKSMEVDRVLFVQPRIDAIASDKLSDAKFAATQLPQWDKSKKKPDPLLSYHAVVLGDVPAKRLSQADQERLADFVSRRGGTLVLVAGKNAMPTQYLNPEVKTKQEPPLAKLIPIRKPQIHDPKDGFQLRLSYQGKSSPFLQLEDDPEDSDAQWTKMPRHYWAATGLAHPGATVLASVKKEHNGPQKDTKEQSKTAARENAIIVMQNYGFGRVLYVGLDSTWRFRYRHGDYYHHRFWGQIMLWAASEQLLPAGNEYVRYGTKQPVYKADEPVEVFARLENAAPPMPPDAKINAKILQRDEQGKEAVVSTIAMKPDGTGQRRFKGSLDKLPAGKYRIAMDIPALNDKIKANASEPADQQQRDTFVVTAVPTKEMTELAANVALLDRLAYESGNTAKHKTLDLQQLDELVGRLNQQVLVRSRYEEQKLWQDEPLAWYFFAAILMLLSVEWITRKFAGLP